MKVFLLVIIFNGGYKAQENLYPMADMTICNEAITRSKTDTCPIKECEDYVVLTCVGGEGQVSYSKFRGF